MLQKHTFFSTEKKDLKKGYYAIKYSINQITLFIRKNRMERI